MPRTNNRTFSKPKSIAKDQRGFFAIAYIINLIIGFIIAVLGLRFVFRLFAANPNNPIANFVYEVSQPFVTPFFGLFRYQPELGAGRFEFETLIAIVVYGLIASVVAGAFTRRRPV